MSIHLQHGRWWTIVCPPSGALPNGYKGLHHQRSMYPDNGINPSLVVHQIYQWHNLHLEGPTGFTLVLSHNQGIKLVALCLLLRVRNFNIVVDIVARAVLLEV